MDKIPDFVLNLIVETYDGFYTLKDLIKLTLPKNQKIIKANWIVSCENDTLMLDSFQALTKSYQLNLITTPLGKIMVLNKQ
jgi:hypothetical protein